MGGKDSFPTKAPSTHVLHPGKEAATANHSPQLLASTGQSLCVKPFLEQKISKLNLINI